jgi:phosphate transport system substrate-binding protein
MKATWIGFGVLLGAAAIVGASQSRVVTVRGSDTMLVLNQRWVEGFLAGNPKASVSVEGGGSGLGISAFVAGFADIGASSRDLTRDEVDAARSRGRIANRIPVALDGLAIAVQAENGVPSLSMEQVRSIFTGRVTNWSQVGGPNRPIVLFGRDSNSGTHDFFQLRVLRNQPWASGIRTVISTGEIARQVASNPGGIGYGGVAYFKNVPGVRVLPISARAGADPVEPSEENVRSKRYPIWRHLYFITNGKPSGDTKRFVDFVLSPEGARIAEEVGYFSLKKP